MNTAKGFMIGVLAGGTIGTIVALLTAPKSGKQLRGDIKQKSGEYLDEAEKFYTETKNKANDIINNGKKKYASLVHDVKEKPNGILKDAEQFFTETKAKTMNAIQTSKEKLEAESQHLKSSVDAGIETYKKDIKKS
jgi:gas vesicle protein